MPTLSYQELIDEKPFRCWTLYELLDGRRPENTNNDHTKIGGHGPDFYAAVDTMYPGVPGEPSAGGGRWSCPPQAEVVAPCWGYVSQTRDYEHDNSGALVWLNILLGEPPPVPLPGEKWDPAWADVATGWKTMLLHMSEIFVAKRMVVPPGLLLGRLMDLKGGRPFVPHVHNELHPLKGYPNFNDPRDLYYDGLTAIQSGWRWNEETQTWLTPAESEKIAEIKLTVVSALSDLDCARKKLISIL